MSHSCDEYYDVYNEKTRTANKEHTCDACEETILKGHRYTVVSWVFEGSAESCKRCMKCQALHLHLRKLEPGEMWPSERLDCGRDYKEHWGKDPPPEIAALAFMSQDEAQKLELAND